MVFFVANINYLDFLKEHNTGTGVCSGGEGDVLAVHRNKAGLKTSVSTFYVLRKHQLLLNPHENGNDEDDDDDDTWNTWSLQLFSPACS